MRVYIDTSVVGGYYDKEFEEDTKAFFKKAEDGIFTLVVSDLLEIELEYAPFQVKTHLSHYGVNQKEKVRITKEATLLAEQYLQEGVVGETSRTDCEHIAIATICKADVLVSWNFKHIVNLKRIRGYNSVNLKLGYSLLEIRTPKEILAL